MDHDERLRRAELAASRVAQLVELQRHCRLCPRECGAARLEGAVGSCQLGANVVVANHGAHFGEERPLVGWGGSGAVFFAGCNLHCEFCQNSEISQHVYGRELEPPQLANVMLELQSRGCHNLNLVSPTHNVAAIVQALALALAQGLTLPIVYNTGGFERVETLQLLDGLVDIYLPDFKYGVAGPDRRYSSAPGYVTVCRNALQEMHRQVGDLVVDEQGLARRGLLVRHLVLPRNLAGSREVAEFLAEEISLTTYVNVMAQYRPEYHARKHPDLARRVSPEEVEEAREAFRAVGLHRFDR